MTPEELAELRREFAEYVTPQERQPGDIDTAMLAEVLGVKSNAARSHMERIAKERADKYQIVRVRDGNVYRNVLRRIR